MRSRAGETISSAIFSSWDRSSHGGGHHLAHVHVDDDGIGGVIRQGDHVELLPQLGGRDVGVRAVHIGDHDDADVFGGGGLDLIHAGDGHDGRLQRICHQFLDVAGVGAHVGGHDHGHGHLHVGHQRHLELGAEQDAENDDHDGGQQRGHLMLDTSLCNIHGA